MSRKSRAALVLALALTSEESPAMGDPLILLSGMPGKGIDPQIHALYFRHISASKEGLAPFKIAVFGVERRASNRFLSP